MEILGVKGFDKDLKCRDTQFTIGETFEIQETPRLCKRGFHFSRNLKQAMEFYPHKNGNRYCEVLALGDIENGDDKLVTNKIKILRELTQDDICATLEGINLTMVRKAVQNGGIICGSFALKLQGFDLGRPIKDLDFIFPDNNAVNVVFKDLDIAVMGSWIVENKNVKNRRAFFDKDYKLTYDVFIKEDESFREVTYFGEKIRVADPLRIWKEKLNYAFMGNTKHAKDFQKFAHKLSYSLIVSYK